MSLPIPAAGRSGWFRCAPGEGITLGWIMFIHVSAIVGLALAVPPTLPVLLASIVLVFLGGLGTTVAYHRALAHKAASLNVVVEQFLVFCAVLNGSGNPLTWVANHRKHHAVSDTVEDISSPHYGGFWWAHLRWLWQAEAAPIANYSPDLAKHLRYSRWGFFQPAVLAISLFGGLLWPGADSWSETLTACLWLGPVRLLWALHAQCTVNSVCHLGQPSGVGGSSKNVWWLAFIHLFQGENWHANHHQRQIDPRLGQKWWQIDIGWYTLVALRSVGLASKLRVPDKDAPAVAAG